MIILDIYLEDDVICMKIKDVATIILLDNNIDNRQLMRKFNWKRINIESGPRILKDRPYLSVWK